MRVELITPILQGSVASNGMQARMYKEVRPGVEPGLLPYQGSVRPQHLQTISSGSGSRTRRIELMRLKWALAHPQNSSRFQVQG